MDGLRSAVLRAKFASHTPVAVHHPPRLIEVIREVEVAPPPPTEKKPVEVTADELLALTERFCALERKISKIMHIVGLHDESPIVGPRFVMLADIRREVREYYGVTDAELDQPTKGRASVYTARQIAFFLCRKLTSRSWPAIGQAFHRDHTSAMHGVEKIRARMLTDEQMSADIAKIEENLGALLRRRQEAAQAE